MRATCFGLHCVLYLIWVIPMLVWWGCEGGRKRRGIAVEVNVGSPRRRAGLVRSHGRSAEKYSVPRPGSVGKK